MNLTLLIFLFTACVGVAPEDVNVPTISPKIIRTQQATFTDTLEPTLTPEPIIQGQYESGSVEVLEMDRDLVVEQCQLVTSAFDQRAYSSGWVQRTVTDVLFNNSDNEYADPVMREQWIRVDSEGYIVEGFAWMSTLEGEILQEVIHLNGWYDDIYRNQWYNLDYDSFGPDGEIQDPAPNITEPNHFTASFCNKIVELDSPQMAIVYFADAEALRFSVEDQYINTYGKEVNLLIAMYFDRATGTHLGTETYEVLPDDRLKVVSGSENLTYVFNADPPKERFAEIWARVPLGDTFVPLEMGAP